MACLKGKTVGSSRGVTAMECARLQNLLDVNVHQ